MAEVKMDPLPNSNAKKLKESNDKEVKEILEPEDQKINVVAKGKIQKKTFGEKFKEIFIGEDIQNVGEYILKEVVVPTIKNTVVDIIQNGISLLIFGESSSKNSNRRNGQYVSYGSYSSNSSRDRRRDDRRDAPNDKGNIIFNSRGDAQAVLDHLLDILDTYRAVTVANYYEAADVPSNYQDRKWGWTDLRYVDIRMARGGGWYIDLPRVEYID